MSHAVPRMQLQCDRRVRRALAWIHLPPEAQ